MKVSNFFTLTRVVLAPMFFVIFFLPKWIGTWEAGSVYVLVPLFIFMEFTDFLDGHFARKKNEVSDFGKVFDPFADVIANLTVLFCFVLSGYMLPVFFLIILYRELSQTFLRMIASRKGIAIAAKMSGKIKTVLYIVAASVSLCIESLQRLSLHTKINSSFFIIFNRIGFALYALAVFASVYSFLGYAFSFKEVLKS